MSDLRTLHDAFAELERRVDAAATGTAPISRPRRAVRLVPVAATVVAVACLGAGAVWLAPGNSATPVAGPPATASSMSNARNPVPTTPDDLIARFRVVLGDTATFEVTQKHNVPRASTSNQPGPGMGVTRLDGPDGDPMVSGTLTSAGLTGSFGLTYFSPSDSGPDEWCNSLRSQDCVVSTLPDGSRLATGSARPDTGAVSYLTCVKRPDGALVLLFLSNQESPIGAAIHAPGGRILSPRPPLSLDQLQAIATSDKW